jgi:hypothetical protein
MSRDTVLSIAAGILIALNGATFRYTLEIEHRLTRMEALYEADQKAHQKTRAPVTAASQDRPEKGAVP